MKIYYGGTSDNHHLFVTPGHDYPTVFEWRHADGSLKNFDIHFKYGVAEVDDKLGEYCIEKGLAKKSRLITDINEVA